MGYFAATWYIFDEDQSAVGGERVRDNVSRVCHLTSCVKCLESTDIRLCHFSIRTRYYKHTVECDSALALYSILISPHSFSTVWLDVFNLIGWRHQFDQMTSSIWLEDVIAVSCKLIVIEHKLNVMIHEYSFQTQTGYFEAYYLIFNKP